MKVTGSATLSAPPGKVWSTLLDPAVLQRSIPGCERLEALGPDRYRGTIVAGVASIKGAFQGEVELTDLHEPDSLVLRASGSGGPGTVQADVAVRLADLGDGRTEVSYDATAVVGGMVGGVGQRVLSGVARKMAGQFFAAVDDELTGRLPAPALSEERTERASIPAVRAGSAAGSGGFGEPAFVLGAVFGAGIALAGVVVGALVGRSRRQCP